MMDNEKYILEFIKRLRRMIKRDVIVTSSLFFPAAAAADSKLVSDEHVKDFIHTLIPVDLFSKTNSANLTFEKSQRHPSYIMPKKQKGLGKPH